MSVNLPLRGSDSRPSAQDPKREADKDSLASVLKFSERSDLVVLVEAISSNIVQRFNQPPGGQSPSEQLGNEPVSDAPQEKRKGEAVYIPTQEVRALQRAELGWYRRWHEAVLRRVCEAANTRWEPIGGAAKPDAKRKSWDELSWNDEDTKADAVDTTAADDNIQALYPPVDTPLQSLDRDKRLLVLHSMLLILLSLKHYTAPSRLLLLHLTSSLKLSQSDLDTDEEHTATSLVSGVKALSASEEVSRKAKENQSSRSWKVLGASIAGAAVIGLTGGLAAPLVAAGIGTVLGGLGLGATAAAGLLGSLAGSSVLVGGLFGAYGARMTGQMMDQYAQEISDFAFVPLHGKAVQSPADHAARAGEPQADDDRPPPDIDPADRRLRVTIAVSGWLSERSDVVEPWMVLGSRAEAFALRWELECLHNLGSGLRDMVTSAAWNMARSEVLKLTVFSTLVGAMALPLGLLKLGSLVDNPFAIATTRADKAGKVLADALINRAQGKRPVTLIGYSLGARLIYSCLLQLAARRGFGLVESVVLIGAPTPNSKSAWHMVRSVVAGRVVNIYSANDYVLGFLYRTNSVQVGVAGLQKVGVEGVEDVDVSEMVTSHFQYRFLTGRLLKQIGWEDLDEHEL